MTDLFQQPDYYQLDELLSEEHKMIREATRHWVKRSVSPIIEDYAQRAACPVAFSQRNGSGRSFGPYIPQEYGGAGLDHVSYGLMMQEVERGDSGILFYLFCAKFFGQCFPFLPTVARSKKAFPSQTCYRRVFRFVRSNRSPILDQTRVE